MDWTNMLKDIWEIVIIPLLGVLTIYLVNFVKAKNAALKQQTDNELQKKYMDMLETTIISCVLTTNQTYTEALKKKGEFGVEAQKEAFKKTYEAVIQILSQDAINYLQTAVGDLQLFITQRIEAEVSANKKELKPAE